MPTDTLSADPIKFLKNGDLCTEINGEKTVIAHYDRKTGDLEYASVAVSKEHARGIAFAVGTVNQGKSASGLVIKTMGIKGQPRDNPKNVPPRPKRDANLGDQTPAYQKWLLDFYPKQFAIQYQCFLDAEGNFIRRKVKRRFEEFIDDRPDGAYGLEEKNDGKGSQVGKGKWEKSAVAIVKAEEVLEGQIIARRGTPLTYTPNEVVGGFDATDDFDAEAPQGGEGGEE